MQILSKQIGRLPFALVSILLYISVPLYYAAWEYETVEPYLSEPTGLVMGLFSILGSGIPFCFAHQVGVLASLEFTAPFALLLLLVTLWRCNDCRVSRRARRSCNSLSQNFTIIPSLSNHCFYHSIIALPYRQDNPSGDVAP